MAADTPPFQHTPDATAPGSMILTVNGASLCVTGRGFFTDESVDRLFERLRHVVASTRNDHPRFDVLVDIRGAPVQGPATTMRIETETRQIWTADDRVAVVVRAGLSKLQAARIVDAGNHRIFDTIDAARQWLDAG